MGFEGGDDFCDDADSRVRVWSGGMTTVGAKSEPDVYVALFVDGRERVERVVVEKLKTHATLIEDHGDCIRASTVDGLQMLSDVASTSIAGTFFIKTESEDYGADGFVRRWLREECFED